MKTLPLRPRFDYAPLAAFAAALLAIVTVFALSADDRGAALSAFFLKPFSSWWYFGNLLNLAALYALAGLGASLALTGGTFNLGGEAQIYLSALAAAVTLNSASATVGPASAMAAGLAAAVLTGALLGFLPGLLRVLRGTSELLTSFLLSAATVPAVDYLIGGPLRDASKNLLATREIPEALRLLSLAPPSYLNVSFPAAIALAAGIALFLRRTAPGYAFRVSGSAPEFARFAGLPVGAVTLWGMTAAGAFHGAAGFAAVAGTWYRCHQGFSAGMGWSALAAALMARGNPLAVLPAAFLLAWLQSASGAALLSTRLGFDAAALAQAAIFLVVSARLIRERRKTP